MIYIKALVPCFSTFHRLSGISACETERAG
jgi:hypothetical protein